MKLLGIDVGTTGVKAGVFSQDGQMLGCGMETYGVDLPAPGRAEQDGALVWQKTKLAVRAAVAQGGGDVAAASVSAQGDALLLLDREQRLLAPVQLGMDYRGSAQAEEMEKRWGKEALYKRTGMPPHPLNFFLKLMWVATNHPALLQKTHRAMTNADFMVLRLCGEAKLDSGSAGRTMAVRLSDGRWDQELLDAAGVAQEKLSEICPSGTPVGWVRKELAQELGLSEKTIVAAGAHDQVCAALGAGVCKVGMALDSHGTAEVVSTLLPAPALTGGLLAGGCPCYPYALPGKFFTFGLNHTGGVCLQRYKDFFAVEGYGPLLEALPEEPTRLLTVPILQAVESGMSMGTVTGLSLSTTREEAVKSLLEGLCFEMRRYLELFQQEGGAVEELRCVGGGARFPAGLQLKADVYGRPVATLRVREAACLGAALLAGKAAGIYASLEESAAAAARVEAVYQPNSKKRNLYQQKYEEYLRLRRNLQETE